MRMKENTLAVIGLGYVGLPVAVLAAQQQWNVIGVDTDEAKVNAINDGTSPFEDETLTKQLASKPFTATTDPAAVATADMVIVAVPTPVSDDHSPDLTPLSNALTSILPHLQADQVLSIESTVNPGVMAEIVVPLLAKRADLPLDATVGEDSSLRLVHCPERINPGDNKWTIKNIPRVLGGYSDAGTTKAREFYESIIDGEVKVMGTVTEAEAVKILENTFRDINIAFINEMARSFDKLDIDITNVIAGAATKPFAFMPHYPGNGVGGHCISVDPYYMIERARQVGFEHEFLKLARIINDGMPAYTVELLEQLAKEAKVELSAAPIALLGLAYKKNIDDVRESPALETQRLLEDAGYEISVWDPFLPDRSTVDSLAAALNEAEALMLACDHDDIVQALTPAALTKAGIKVVIDGKNALDGAAIAAAGIKYHGVGRS